MKNSAERIAYITRYISAYEEEIKLANHFGMFDSAHLFELFAKELCELWFHKTFKNLNAIKLNYPCVDLISEDGTTYVQVSTQKDMCTKIKETLKKLSESKDSRIANISCPIFFVLSNESEPSVEAISENNPIGNYYFSASKSFISTEKIVNEAICDLDFQNNLYELLKRDEEAINRVSSKLAEVFEHSKEVRLKHIETKINGEYEIDRSELANEIKTDLSQFVIVTGEAGSGKSAICKKVINEEEYVLFLRADTIGDCNAIDNLWNIDIAQSLRLLDGKKIVIYLDALEYIANASNSTKELVCTLLYECQKYKSVFFYTSCRSCDVVAFFQMLSMFHFKSYEVGPISDKELGLICQRYPIIRKMVETGKYDEVLRSPFYINHIITQKVDVSELSDVNQFRDYIWKECICLYGKAQEQRVSTLEICSAVKELVIERSRQFVLGISEEKIEAKILNMLESNGVVIKVGKLVRLKYDIYEDICFERIFDEAFDTCKGKYESFFEYIEGLGQGIYRRYHIWISNKLLAKENRDYFLSALIYDGYISEVWRRNTIVGLIKSSYSESFFEEQGSEILEQGLLRSFVDITNYFGFEMKGIKENTIGSIMSLETKASGVGRIELIKLIYRNLFQIDELCEKRKVIKLCYDYVRRASRLEKIDKVVCKIVSYYIDSFVNKLFNDDANTRDTIFDEEISHALEIVYEMESLATEWIDGFWARLGTLYCEDEPQKSIAINIMNWTIENVTQELVYSKGDALIKMAELVWLKGSVDSKYEYFNSMIGNDLEWGIFGEGKNYNYEHRNVREDKLIRFMCYARFNEMLEWSIDVINRLTIEYANNRPNDVSKIELFDSLTGARKTFWGTEIMWHAGRLEHTVPALIGDIVFWLKTSAIASLSGLKANYPNFVQLADWIKKVIWEKSNNIIPLTIIETVGFEFMELLPGYAVGVMSNINILYWDVHRFINCIEIPEREELIEQAQKVLSLSGVRNRYPCNKSDYMNLQGYMVNTQLFADKKVKECCYQTIDYMYKSIEGDNNALDLLQIQKMDLRNATFEHCEGSTVSVVPKLSPETEKIVQVNEESNQQMRDLSEKISLIIEKNQNNSFNDIDEYLNILDNYMEQEDKRLVYEKDYFSIIRIAINLPDIPKDRKSELICFWAGIVIEQLSQNRVMRDYISRADCLISQYNVDTDDKAKNAIKKMVLLSVIGNYPYGNIYEIRKAAFGLLLADGRMAKVFFDTIMAISIYVWKYKKDYHEKKFSDISDDYWLNEIEETANSEGQFTSLGVGIPKPIVEEIIDRYLYKEEVLDANSINLYEMDLNYLLIAMNTGLRLNSPEFYVIAKEVFKLLLGAMNENNLSHLLHPITEFESMVKRELSDEKTDYKTVVDFLYDNIDYTIFSRDTCKIYLDIFKQLQEIYFDAYDNPEKRRRYCECINYVEEKIGKIDVWFVKKEMERIMIFAIDRYGMDWNEYKTRYSLSDKRFLLNKWEKYCDGHEKEIIVAIYNMHIGELLPEVIPTIVKVISNDKRASWLFDKNYIEIMQTIMLKAYVYYRDVIKMNIRIHDAYVDMLEFFISHGNEAAAVIMDEYMSH